MRKKNYEIRVIPCKLVKVKGFAASIKTPGNLKFGVCEFQGKWRTTELSTGMAVPTSFAESAEESVKKAQISIDSINSEKTFFQGQVKGALLLLKYLEEKQ